MNLLYGNLTRKFTCFLGIVGVSSAITIAGYAEINQQAMADTRPHNYTILPRISEIDRVYVQEANQAGMAEVELAKLALERSKNEQVRQYAQQMIQDHTPLNQELMQLAQQKGITPSTNPSPKYQALKAQLSEFDGSIFDEAYINEAGINGNMENLVIHTRQIQLGQDPDLQAFAAKSIPVVETHLQLLDFLLI
ncbi:DUF4142 domain-containing protein [Chrysosporum bergii ANA360D]|jgi:putative membrane protein|uniref:DUF4142 domain-containing protein n=1 Tax=Chrysosporum bergii ANA360D TaxID=617107 RepID=A0AA43GRF1_9CYAN|nr:DUF4142 domain-containing protein [Chrysosporum bergii]MDH6060250.1 DUF4142 domain-containing protein [Chrysosporum bergii ANA360D]